MIGILANLRLGLDESKQEDIVFRKIRENYDSCKINPEMLCLRNGNNANECKCRREEVCIYRAIV